MKRVQRLEIIIDAVHRARVLEVLALQGCDGWSILPVVAGYGQRGARGLEGLPGGQENELILAAVDETQWEAVVEGLRPLLERWGGVCLVSEARWLKHDSPSGATL